MSWSGNTPVMFMEKSAKKYAYMSTYKRERFPEPEMPLQIPRTHSAQVLRESLPLSSTWVNNRFIAVMTLALAPLLLPTSTFACIWI